MSTGIEIVDYPTGLQRLEEASTAHPASVAIRPMPRRIWQPWEIEMATVGDDNRFVAWRYIMPTDAAILTKPYPMEGCQDLTVFIQTGGSAGTPTLTVSLSVSMFGGSDFWNNSKSITPAGTDMNVVTTSATAGRFLVISTAWQPSPFDATTATNWASQLRGVTWNFWALSLTASAADVMPVTIWAVGR
jgi:hypothetical protein